MGGPKAPSEDFFPTNTGLMSPIPDISLPAHAQLNMPSGGGPGFDYGGQGSPIASLGNMPSSAPSAPASHPKMNVLDVIQGLAGLTNTGLGLYGAISQKRPGSDILRGSSGGGGLSQFGGASMGGGGGGGDKLGGNIPSPQAIQSAVMGQQGLPNNHHFQVLLNLLGVKEG